MGGCGWVGESSASDACEVNLRQLLSWLVFKCRELLLGLLMPSALINVLANVFGTLWVAEKGFEHTKWD
jgi:hypothetical protein